MEKEKDTHEDKTSRAVTGINIINIPKGKDEAFVSITTLAKRIDMHPNTLKKSIIKIQKEFKIKNFKIVYGEKGQIKGVIKKR